MKPIRVEATGLSKAYDEHEVLRDVTFTLEPGTVTAFLGRNGAGKSTTVRRLAGLVHGGGEVTFDGRPLLEHDEPHRVLGVDLGTAQMHPGRTVRNHLRLLARGLPTPHNRVDEVLALMGIERLADSRPRAFSTGMKRAVALAGTILAKPSVLVLDEPINGLEVAAVHRFKALLRSHADRGGTVMVASHILAEAERVADRVLVLECGRVIADEPLGRFLKRHRPTEVEVQTDDPAAMLRALKGAGLGVRQEGFGVLVVETSDPREVARRARDVGVLVHRLTLRQATLEDAFLGAAAGGTQSPTHALGEAAR